MAPFSYLSIADWKENQYTVDVSKPEVVGLFSKELKNKELFVKSIYPKFLDSDAKLDVASLESKFEEFCLDASSGNIHEVLNEFKQWRKDHVDAVKKCGPQFVTSSEVLAKIMVSPFCIHEEIHEWSVNVKLEGTIIYLFEENDVLQPKPSLVASYEKLKRYLFKTWPVSLNRHVNSLFYQNMYEVLQVKIGENKVMYSAECPGLISDINVSNVSELNTVEHAHCDVYESGEYLDDVIRYNPIWWSKAKLINAKRGFIGAFNPNEDRLEHIIEYNSSTFEDIKNFENLWSPDAAWSFLEVFLCYVKQQVVSISPNIYLIKNTLWKFTFNKNGKKCVICEIFIEEAVDGILLWKSLF